MIKIEVGVDNLLPSFPFEVYADVNFSKFGKTVYILGRDSDNIGEPWITSISLGIKMPLWRKMKQIP